MLQNAETPKNGHYFVRYFLKDTSGVVSLFVFFFLITSVESPPRQE